MSQGSPTTPAATSPAVVDAFVGCDGMPRIPIVLGVVGLRKIAAGAETVLKKKLGEIFASFREAYPHTPLVLLSALAEGADQLAADVALGQPPEHKVTVRAPLPFTPEVYRASTSFDTDAARQKLDQLLEDPRVEAFSLPLPDGRVPEGTDWGVVAATRTDEALMNLRRACYANTGGYIVRRCHLLIAMWDDKESGRPSGTAEHVRFRLEGQPPQHYPWPVSEPLGFRGDRGPVCVLFTPRAGDADAQTHRGGEMSLRLPSQPMTDARLLARPRRPWHSFVQRVRTAAGFGLPHASEEPAELRQYHEICQAVDDFNKDVEQILQGKKKDEVLVKISSAAGNVPFVDPARRWLIRLSAVRETAAALSRALAPRVEDWARIGVFLLLLLSLMVFHLYSHLHRVDESGQTVHYPAFLWGFWLLLLAAALWVGCVWWTRLDERRLDYRALAESLRVRRAWAMAGIGASVADSYLGQLRGEMSWARKALFHVCPPPRVWADAFAALSPEHRKELLRNVRDEWVKGQVRQYDKSWKKQHRWASRLRLTGFLLAVLGWLLVPLFFSLQLATAGHPPVWLLIASGMLVITGGLCIAFGERRSHEELAKQYERMHVVFENGLEELDARLAKGELGRAQEILHALGREAITEHAQWLILRRARPLELHIGG